MMDHPNIAKVFDAGTHRNRPALFCHGAGPGRAAHRLLRRARLTTRERLELFVPSATRCSTPIKKGSSIAISSRSNILVAMHDERADAQDHRLRRGQGHHQRSPNRRCDTVNAQMIGTPLYMCPEQAELIQLGHRHAQRHLFAWECCCTNCLPARRHSTRTACTPPPATNYVASSRRRAAAAKCPPRQLVAEVATTVAEQRRTDSADSSRRSAANSIGS